ncbi:MAG TPA: DoxX family membrane protein [Candidatus Omnitrophota bacterium]|nr:DoxX family membrane protein [Candidatus Omnitrophota bacterium]HPD84931.1 DoxX family membrane protein [Candidatus Omnitrophota bacterium]HRZ03789.1 DoxX family membrane protein [Candidatus Omnitrophota bacterium]
MALAIIRILIGIFFVVSGFEKLINPYENFLYVVQSYELVGKPLDLLTAWFMPWIEFILGVFMILGLWLKITLRGMWALLIIFIFVLGQAILRNLPITECGCFGDLLPLPLAVTVAMDTVLLITVTFLRAFIQKTSLLSLDRYFLSKQ